MTHYTYFQTAIKGVEHVKIIPAGDLYFAQKPGKRNEELLLSAQQCGIILPPILSNKVDYTMASAVVEAERGALYRIRNLAPNMSQSERQHALDNIGDTHEVHEKAERMQLGPTPQGTIHVVREQELGHNNQRLMVQHQPALLQREPDHHSRHPMVQHQRAPLQLHPVNLHRPHQHKLDSNKRLLLRQDQNREHQEKTSYNRRFINQTNEDRMNLGKHLHQHRPPDD